MAEIALGWLGWTERDALSADVNAILVAYEGRLSMFETVGWVTRAKNTAPEENEEQGPGMSPALFDAMFG